MNGSTIKTVDGLVQWLQTLDRTAVALDTETTSLKQAELECLGLSLCDGKQSCYIDLLDGDQYSGLLEVLKAEIPRIQRVIMHGAPFDMRVLSKLGVGHTEDIVCTMTAAFLLDENGGVGLKELAVRYLGVQPSDAISWKVASIGGFKSETFYSYGRRDAEWTWALWRLLDARLEEAGLYPLFYDIEMPFQFVLRDLEINGVFINQGALSTLRASLNEEADKLQLDTYRAGGINCVSETNLLGEVSHRPEVNIDSPLQLSDFIVNRLGIDIAALSESGTSVDKHVLGQLENKHEFFRCLLAYRTANKLKTMFLDKAPSFVDSDGRIRASFNNCIAHTGRLTSSNPNLQQLPKKGTKHGSVRSLIIAPPGYTLLAADYAGFELRVLAEVSRDLTMIAAFILGQDLHLTMANKFFGLGIPEPLLYEQHPQHKEVRSKYKNERDKSKTINFGIAYGKAQPLTTPIPAPHGWTTMGQLHIGTEVFAADGTVTTVTGVYPQGVRPVYKITMQDGSSTLCDEEHLWEIQTTYDRKLRRSRVLRTIDIVPVLMKGTQHNCSIRRCDPLRYHAQKQPIPPYLMGLYIGDGWCNGSIGLCLPVDSTRQEVERLLLPNHTLVHAGRYNYRITAPHKRNARGQYTNQNYYLNVIRELGLGECQSYTKFIPSQYLHGSVEQRQELWRGLLDSDGADNHNSYEYSTSSPQLAKDVQELVRSLGGRCTISTRVPTYQYGEGRVSYRLMISFPPYSQTNCIESIVYVGDMPCQCVSVAHESQLYVTEDYLVTHNTAQGFSQDWNISRAEAEGVVARYFEAAPRVRDAIEECKCFLNSHGYVVNLAGRYRHLPVGNNRSYRQAFNFLIQGFSADLVKLASVKVRRLCLSHPEWGCNIVLQVHDELVYEIKTEYVNEALPLIKYTMEHVWSLSVPMVADIQTGQNYQECK